MPRQLRSVALPEAEVSLEGELEIQTAVERLRLSRSVGLQPGECGQKRVEHQQPLGRDGHVQGASVRLDPSQRSGAPDFDSREIHLRGIDRDHTVVHRRSCEQRIDFHFTNPAVLEIE
jgi:hypothetical protein